MRYSAISCLGASATPTVATPGWPLVIGVAETCTGPDPCSAAKSVHGLRSAHTLFIGQSSATVCLDEKPFAIVGVAGRFLLETPSLQPCSLLEWIDRTG